MGDTFEIAMQRVARNLRARRAELGLSQEAVAFDTEIGLRRYQELEADRGANPTVRTLSRIADVLEISLSDVFAARPRRRSK
jgi:transcriptional regulator with XRE-family HTH domain